MRNSFLNLSSVQYQVEYLRNRSNILMWYTGDEPDGTSDPLNATTTTYDLINSLDGYHPVSLVLNCEDYYWTEYTRGTDIVMQDTYMIGINATFSVVWVRSLPRSLSSLSFSAFAQARLTRTYDHIGHPMYARLRRLRVRQLRGLLRRH